MNRGVCLIFLMNNNFFKDGGGGNIQRPRRLVIKKNKKKEKKLRAQDKASQLKNRHVCQSLVRSLMEKPLNSFDAMTHVVTSKRMWLTTSESGLFDSSKDSSIFLLPNAPATPNEEWKRSFTVLVP